MLDFKNRQGVFGTTAFYDFFPGVNTTVNDDIVLAPLTNAVPKIKDVMNTVGGNLCYVYI